MQVLTEEEKEQVAPLLQVLEDVARRMVRRGRYGYEANYSAGFVGLIHYLRTPATGDPDKWLDICISNHIRMSRRRDYRYTDKAKPYEDEEGPPAPAPELSPVYDLLEELPAYLRKTTIAMLNVNGNKREAASLLGISPRDLEERLELIREKVRP